MLTVLDNVMQDVQFRVAASQLSYRFRRMARLERRQIARNHSRPDNFFIASPIDSPMR